MKNALIAAVLTGLSTMAFAAPTNWLQTVTYNGETITNQLTRHDLRGSNFELWAQNTNGTYDVVTPVAERSYLGSVAGYPGAVSCGILKDDGTFWGVVYFDRGETWYTLGTNVYMTRAEGYDLFNGFRPPSHPSVGAGQAGTDMYAFDVGVDVDYDYFDQTGSLAASLEGIEFSVCAVGAIYMRDALLRPYLGRVIVRSSLAHDPYTGLTQGGYLGALASEWNNNHTNAVRDLVVGASPTKIGGGLAWVGVVGTGSAYSVNDTFADGNFTVVWRHEMGHNGGCWHSVGDNPEGSGLMGGNTPGRFSGPEVNVVLNHRDSRPAGVLTNEGIFTDIELPPYASMDSGTFVQTVTASVNFNVLANDHDANGQVLSLSSFAAASGHGGTVTQQGQNLVYTAPGAFLGTDYFTYTVTDTAGRSATGAVVVDVQPNDALRLYLALDETSGTQASDDSGFSRNGTLSGTDFATASVAGQYGNAINFDGVDDALSVPGMNLSANTITITAWVKPAATQTAFAGIVFDRSVSASGLNIHNDGKLRYHWNDAAATYNWNSGLTPPADTWTFVALVIEPTRAIMHLNAGAGFQSATNTTPHAVATFGTTYVGRDPGNARFYNGAIDDVRIYSHAMSQAELAGIAAGGRAGSPSPFDMAFEVQAPEVNWSPGAAAISNEVYLGTNQAAVAAANTGSPEYQGATAGTGWVFDLLPNTAYFWRIDTVTPSNTIPGTVWSFTTGSTVFEAGLVAHWKLDEGSGNTTEDFSLNNNSGTLNGPAWTNGIAGAALWFDGVNDSVTFGTGTSLGGPTDFTVSAWIKTSSATEQVILQQRNGGFDGQYVFRVLANGTLHFYVYANGGNQFSFGTAATVNDGQWHFVTAVRHGENGYIYMDGNPVPAASASGAIRNLNASIGVGMGRDIRDNNKPFHGLIDEARIYSLAKTGQELADIYYREHPGIGALFGDNFERAAGTTLGNGWIEEVNDSRIYDTGQPATKMLISVLAGTPFSVVKQLGFPYQDGGRYELMWNAARATAASGTLVYDVAIGTWDGATFTPLATRSGSMVTLNHSGKKAGPTVKYTASAGVAGQPVAIRFKVLAGSSDWAGFDDIELRALVALVAPVVYITGPVAGGAAVVISWSSENGQFYGVDTNSTLGAANWNSFTSGIPGNGGIIAVTNIMGPDQTFYRIVTE